LGKGCGIAPKRQPISQQQKGKGLRKGENPFGTLEKQRKTNHRSRNKSRKKKLRGEPSRRDKERGRPASKRQKVAKKEGVEGLRVAEFIDKKLALPG